MALEFDGQLQPILGGGDEALQLIRLKDVDLSDADEATTPADTDLLAIDHPHDGVTSGNQSVTNKITAGNLKTYFQSDVLPLSGGTMAGNITMPNDGKIIFGDAGEYIKGDGTDLTIESSGKINFKVASELVVEDDGGTAQPVVTIKQPAGNYGSSGQLVFDTTRGASTAGQDGDDLGLILFKGHNDAGTPQDTPYARIFAEIDDATDGQESGKLSLGVTTHDGDISNYGLVLTGGSVADEIDVTIGNGDDSLTIIKGKLAFGDSATSANIILSENNMVSDSNSALATQQSIKAYVDNNKKFFCTSAFYHGGNNLEYIPIAGGSTIELSSLHDSGNDDTTFIVPYNLEINTIYVCATRPRSTDQIAGNTNMRLYRNYAQLSGNVTVNMNTIGYDSTDLATVYTFDFSGETNAYTAGDIMQISIDPTLKLYYVSITIVGLYT